MVNVLIGGMITLIVTAVVQIFVIPWVQRRTRALERWERDVVTLMTLVNEELTEKRMSLNLQILLATHAEADVIHGFREDQVDDLADHQVVQAWRDVDVAYDELRAVCTRVTFMQRRCSLIAPRSGYWAVLFNQSQTAWAELGALRKQLHGRPQQHDVDALIEAMARFAKAQDALSETLREITEPIRPPKQPSRWDGWRAQRQLRKPAK